MYALNPPKEEDGDKEPLQFWKRKDNRTLSLREIARIKTLHSVDNFLGREDMSYAAPLYSEVLEQIPKNIFPKVFAFEVLVDDFSREMSDGPDGYDKYDKITTVLYEKIKL